MMRATEDGAIDTDVLSITAQEWAAAESELAEKPSGTLLSHEVNGPNHKKYLPKAGSSFTLHADFVYVNKVFYPCDQQNVEEVEEDRFNLKNYFDDKNPNRASFICRYEQVPYKNFTHSFLKVGPTIYALAYGLNDPRAKSGSYGKVVRVCSRDNQEFAAKLFHPWIKSEFSLLHEFFVGQETGFVLQCVNNFNHPVSLATEMIGCAHVTYSVSISFYYEFDLHEFIERYQKKIQAIQKNGDADFLYRVQSHFVRVLFDICVKLSESLQMLHQKNILHRDIKPKNVLLNVRVTNDDLMSVCVSKVTLGDFGFSTHYKKDTDDLICGTQYYFPPEYTKAALSGKKRIQLTFEADIYSLGKTIFELFEAFLGNDFISRPLLNYVLTNMMHVQIQERLKLQKALFIFHLLLKSELDLSTNERYAHVIAILFKCLPSNEFRLTCWYDFVHAMCAEDPVVFQQFVSVFQEIDARLSRFIALSYVSKKANTSLLALSLQHEIPFVSNHCDEKRLSYVMPFIEILRDKKLLEARQFQDSLLVDFLVIAMQSKTKTIIGYFKSLVMLSTDANFLRVVMIYFISLRRPEKDIRQWLAYYQSEIETKTECIFIVALCKKYVDAKKEFPSSFWMRFFKHFRDDIHVCHTTFFQYYLAELKRLPLDYFILVAVDAFHKATCFFDESYESLLAESCSVLRTKVAVKLLEVFVSIGNHAVTAASRDFWLRFFKVCEDQSHHVYLNKLAALNSAQTPVFYLQFEAYRLFSTTSPEKNALVHFLHEQKNEVRTKLGVRFLVEMAPENITTDTVIANYFWIAFVIEMERRVEAPSILNRILNCKQRGFHPVFLCMMAVHFIFIKHNRQAEGLMTDLFVGDQLRSRLNSALMKTFDVGSFCALLFQLEERHFHVVHDLLNSDAFFDEEKYNERKLKILYDLLYAINCNIPMRLDLFKFLVKEGHLLSSRHPEIMSEEERLTVISRYLVVCGAKANPAGFFYNHQELRRLEKSIEAVHAQKSYMCAVM